MCATSGKKLAETCWDGKMRQLKAQSWLPNTYQLTKFCSSCYPLAVISTSNYEPLKCDALSLVCAVRVSVVIEKISNRNVDPTFLFDFCTQKKAYLLWPH